jgi:hypothetical protein
MATVEQHRLHATSQSDTATRVLPELLENGNYLNLVLHKISTEIFVAFKFRKIYKYKFCSLLTLKAISQIHNTQFWPRDFSYFLFHFYGKCINNLNYGKYIIILNIQNSRYHVAKRQNYNANCRFIV